MRHTFNELSIEELQAIYFDTKALKEPDYRLSRIDARGLRYYYEIEERKVRDFHGETYSRGKNKGKPKKTTKTILEPVFYISMTSFIKASMPTSPYLITWIAQKGEAEARRYAQDRADHGTFMHISYGELAISRKYDLDTLSERLEAFTLEETTQDLGFAGRHLKEMAKDILAFAQFMKDYKVKPLAVEVVLRSKKTGIATAIDLVCELEVPERGFHGETYKTSNSAKGYKKGDPKESIAPVKRMAIIDFKSGKNGFYEEHEIQLEGCKQIWEENYPEHPIERLFNFAPSDWRDKPGYKLKDQTESISRDKYTLMVSLAKVSEERKEKVITSFSGVIDLNEELTNNYELVQLSDYVRDKEEIIRISEDSRELTKDLQQSLAKESENA